MSPHLNVFKMYLWLLLLMVKSNRRRQIVVWFFDDDCFEWTWEMWPHRKKVPGAGSSCSPIPLLSLVSIHQSEHCSAPRCPSQRCSVSLFPSPMTLLHGLFPVDPLFPFPMSLCPTVHAICYDDSPLHYKNINIDPTIEPWTIWNRIKLCSLSSAIRKLVKLKCTEVLSNTQLYQSLWVHSWEAFVY